MHVAKSIVWPLAAAIYTAGGHPSDGSIQTKFSRQQVDFEAIVKLTTENQNLWRITPTWFRTNYDGNHYSPVEGILSKERWSNYNVLFNRLGLEDGISIESRDVFFQISNIGMVGSGSTKGIVYTASPKDFQKANTHLRLVPLSEHWFIFETE